MRMETPISRVRGLGSARSGAHHWWLERLTSVGALVLFVWLIASVLMLPSLDYGTVTEWLRQPLAAVPMLLLVVTTFWHLKMGLQVILEDYVHEEGMKLFSIVLLNFFVLGAGALAFFSVLRIAFSGAAAAAGAPPAPPGV
jgi:succinate dehydrogenase / fumarate reductase membrane anchor subunit